ncbi:hypothetical protein ACEWY4_017224 [Coilia grayii]|uniref:Helix-turn-helix domain-containing protein n=1 Tax=Coilia grayii TaxID=363190 RepID=A0ABD1JG86_9TELE
MIWKGTINELNHFLGFVNSTMEYLSFTMEHDVQPLNFLDLTILKDENNILQTTVYRKPLSKNTLLQADSNHPPHLIRNIPTGQFLRVRRNCSSTHDFMSQACQLAQRFLQRGYAQEVVKIAWGKVQIISTGTFFRVTRLKDICAEPPIFTFRRARNIRDRLVHSDMKASPPTTWLRNLPVGFYKCGNCAHCSNSTNCKDFSHPRTGKLFPIGSFINCNSTHVIYLLKCPCVLVYIGQTKRQLKILISEHKMAIRTKNTTYAMATHYIEANHGSPASLKFWGIERINIEVAILLRNFFVERHFGFLL